MKVAEVKLTYKSNVKASEREKVMQSKDGYKILLNFWDKDEIDYRESFKIILLNRNNKVLGISTISEGGITGTVADVRIIMQTALLSNSSGIILAHNHPSGNLKPSQSDIDLTNKIVKAGKTLDIQVLDHLIITSEGFYSLTDNGDMEY